MAEELQICQYNQKGFCKYCMQCTKEHINQICPIQFQCNDLLCKMRHPKKCKTFDVYGKCKFSDCAYLHVKEVENSKVHALEIEVNELKQEVQKLIQNKNNRNNLKIEILEKELIVLNYEVNQLNINAKKTKEILDELTKTAANDDKIKKVAEDRWYQCKFCINKYKKEVTLNKHIHTKHPDG